MIYGLITFLRNRLFDHNILKSQEFDIPVISVGNINVGGTGKTPHIEYLVSILKKDFRIAVLSRGYKRKTHGFVIASNESTVYDIGDEPRQIKNKFPEIEVAVDEKRARGIQKLIEGYKNLNLILLDDAYQHRFVKPGISILLIDYSYPLYLDHLFPYGRLRESRHEKHRANIILITKSPEFIKPIDKRILIKNIQPFPYQTIYFTSFRYSQPIPVFENIQNTVSYELIQNSNYKALLVTGIANPAPLLVFLRKYCRTISHITFHDHHRFSTNDISKITLSYEAIHSEHKIILTTEKDAMRFRDLPDNKVLTNLPVYFISLEVQFLNGEKRQFDKQIIDYVRKNKRHGILHSKQAGVQP
jgi:tetraacyldisaccharide 4'-kinase